MELLPAYVFVPVVFLMMPAVFLVICVPIYFLVIGGKPTLKKFLVFSFLCSILQGLWVWLVFYWDTFIIIPNILLIVSLLVYFNLKKSLIAFSLTGFLHGFWYWLAFCWSERLFEKGVFDIVLGLLFCLIVGLVGLFLYSLISIICYTVFCFTRRILYSENSKVG